MSEPDRGLVAAYERMRRQRRGIGCELLRRRGLAGWIETAAACLRAPAAPSLATSAPAVPPALETCSGVDESLHPALTRVLADVALGWLQEVGS